MYEREQEAIRRVLQLLAQLRAPWRAHGVSVRRFDVSVKQLKTALNMHGQEAILMRAYTKIDFLLKTAVKRSGLSLAESLNLDALSCEVLALREGRALSVPKRDQAQVDARQFLKAECEGCGGVDNLNAHHEDHDWRNNIPSNVRTLCHDCHVKAHKAQGGFINSCGAVLPAKSAEELQEAASWMVKKILQDLKEFHAWVSGENVPRLCARRNSGWFFSQAKSRFGISIWQNGDFDFYAEKALKEAGIEDYKILVIKLVRRFWQENEYVPD
jgi:hypothetical protein